MKKLIIMAALLLGMAHTAFSEQRGVLMEIHYRSVPGKNLWTTGKSVWIS